MSLRLLVVLLIWRPWKLVWLPRSVRYDMHTFSVLSISKSRYSMLWSLCIHSKASKSIVQAFDFRGDAKTSKEFCLESIIPRHIVEARAADHPTAQSAAGKYLCILRMTSVALISHGTRQPHVSALLLNSLHKKCLRAIAFTPRRSTTVAEVRAASASYGGCQHELQHLVTKILDH